MKSSQKSVVTFEETENSYKVKAAGGTGETNHVASTSSKKFPPLNEEKPQRVIPNNRISADYNFIFKVILLGDSKVGKSSLVKRLIDESFNNKYEETTHYDTVLKRVMTEDGDVVMLHIFDTAGLDRFDSLQGIYFKGAQGFVIVFDYTRSETFQNVTKWIKQLRDRATITDPTIVVLGNKVDIQDKSKIQVTQ